jgi:hypothetical protein
MREAPRAAAPPHDIGRPMTRRRLYFVLPVTVKWARRFLCQHVSFDSWQTGTSLP